MADNVAKQAERAVRPVDDPYDCTMRTEGTTAQPIPKDADSEIRIRRIRIRAERRAGELLAEMPKAKGAMGIGTSAVPPGNPTLSDIGVSKKQSKTWQDLAKVDEEAFEEPLGPEMSQERCPSRCPARMRQQ